MNPILDQLNRPPSEAWKPAPGDTLVGIVTDLDQRDGGYGAYPVITVATEDGTHFSFHAFHTVARAELARRRPVVGDKIGVKFLGKPAGKSYEGYKVVVEHAQPQDTGPDWDAIGAEAAAEGADDGWPADDAAPLTETASGAPPF